MRKVLFTFGTSEARKALAISAPLWAEYAVRHGWEFRVYEKPVVEFASDGRPHSWAKIELLQDLISDNDLVAWVDADVIPVDMAVSVAVHASAPVNLVVQNTPDGAVPSCGVILAKHTSFTDAILRSAWNACGNDGMNSQRSFAWWEQVGMIRALGGDPDPTPIVPPPPSPLWGELPYRFNPHPCDPRGIPDDCYFFHATATNDRLGDMRRWAERIKR